ncbi:MAG: PAS domain S-box protein [Candidatus Nanopelagicales bacterium]
MASAHSSPNSRAAEHTESFFDIFPDLLAIADADGKLVRTNEAWQAVLGYSPDELEGMRILDLVHPEDVDTTLDSREQVLRGLSIDGFVNRYRHRDGSWRYLSWVSRPVDGYVHAIARDVTRERATRETLRSTEAVYRAMLNSPVLGVVLQSPGGIVREVNATAERLLGVTSEQMMGRAPVSDERRTVHLDMSDFTVEDYPATKVLATGEPVGDVVLGVNAPGFESYNWLRVDSQPIERDGEIWAYTTLADVTDLLTAVTDAQAIRRVVDQHEIISVTDLDGRIIEANDRFCQISGYEREELLGRTHAIVSSGRHGDEFYADLWQTITAGDTWSGELCNRRKNGELYWVIATIVPIKDIEGRTTSYMSIRTEITQQKLAEREANRQAHVDGLTGLANRRRFDAELDALCSYSEVSGQPFSVVIADIDFFKNYNDALGHQQGDEALRAVARALSDCLPRRGDLIARWGGEEFALLAPNTDVDGAAISARKLVAAVDALALPHPDSECGDFITVSVGYATATASPIQAAEQVVAQADDRLYQAKAQGRNRIVGPGPSEPATS